MILSPDDVESLEETLAVLADHELVRQLRDSHADLAAGRAHGIEELDEAMRRRPR